MLLGCWNIRGLNSPSKQREISKFVLTHHLDILGITESKVRIPNQSIIQKTLLPSWNFVTNSHPNSVDRIWVGWNPDRVNLFVTLITHQLIHVTVTSIDLSVHFEASFIYGYNTIQGRRALWKDLRIISSSISDAPWICLGDFNVILDPREYFGGNIGIDHGALEFAALVRDTCLQDLRYTGMLFTWSNSTTRKKLDRAMVNPEWLEKYPTSFTHFLSPGISDHSPFVINILNRNKRKGTPFKFYNCWTTLAQFHPVVYNAWTSPMEGNMQFQLFFKLKNLKVALKKLAKESVGNAKLKADKAREDLSKCQLALDASPSDFQLRAQEKTLHKEFLEAIRLEEEIMKQKSRKSYT